MSSTGALLSLLSELVFSLDGALLGVTLAYSAVRSIFKFNAYSAALHKVGGARELHVSDLRSLLPPPDEHTTSPNDRDGTNGDPPIVIVRGTVAPKSVVDGTRRSLSSNGILISKETGDEAVVVERSQTYVYSEWRRIFDYAYDLRGIFGKPLRKRESTSLRTVPFVLIENGQLPQSSYVLVNMDGSRHRLPLTTVHRQLQPINASPYAFLQALLLPEYPVGLLDEEKILPVGKDITAIGICSLENGIPEIKSCKDIPFFLSEMTKEKMIQDLIFGKKVLLWGSIVLSSLSVGVLGFAAVRGWQRWKVWKQQRQPQNHASVDGEMSDEDTEDIPDGQLCVICLTRRRVPAFIPCGHIVCCRSCALAVERELTPKCPVCCQPIRGSLRVYYA